MEHRVVVVKPAAPTFKMAANEGSLTLSEGLGGRNNEPVFNKIDVFNKDSLDDQTMSSGDEMSVLQLADVGYCNYHAELDHPLHSTRR